MIFQILERALNHIQFKFGVVIILLSLLSPVIEDQFNLSLFVTGLIIGLIATLFGLGRAFLEIFRERETKELQERILMEKNMWKNSKFGQKVVAHQKKDKKLKEYQVKNQEELVNEFRSNNADEIYKLEELKEDISEALKHVGLNTKFKVLQDSAFLSVSINFSNPILDVSFEMKENPPKSTNKMPKSTNLYIFKVTNYRAAFNPTISIYRNLEDVEKICSKIIATYLSDNNIH